MSHKVNLDFNSENKDLSITLDGKEIENIQELCCSVFEFDGELFKNLVVITHKKGDDGGVIRTIMRWTWSIDNTDSAVAFESKEESIPKVGVSLVKSLLK